MSRECLFVAVVLGATLAPPQADAETPEPGLEQVVSRYVEARGGAARWREVKSLSIKGTYAALSQRSPFTLLRRRDDVYRLDFTVMGGPGTRARDSEGPWWRSALEDQPQPVRADEGPYKAQLERESLFGPLLLDASSKGVSVELVGPGDVEGQPTIDLEVSLPDGAKEIWHLDRETFLEVAIDSQVVDHTQGPRPMARRVFFDDFRTVDGLVLPFQVDYEFGARLEAMTVEEVVVDAELADERFSPPPP
jgi:hypothetical protein